MYMEKIKTLLFTLSITLLLGLASCNRENSNIVKYEVSCSPGGFFITYVNSGGNTEQRDVSTTSWTASFTGNSGDFVYVSAQANSENATVTARIYYMGDLLETATSNGDYVIASASTS